MSDSWRKNETDTLARMDREGKSDEEISKALCRSIKGIRQKRYYMRSADYRRGSTGVQTCIDCPAQVEKFAKRCKNCHQAFLAAKKLVAPVESKTMASPWMTLPDGVAVRTVGAE